MKDVVYGCSSLLLCRRIAVVAFVVIAGAGIACGRDLRTKVDQSCGPQALATAFSLLGQQVELSQCAIVAATDANGITTMSGLEDGARSLGASVRGMKLTPEEIGQLNRVAILHVTRPDTADHYVVFRSHRDGLFEVVDPSRAQTSQFYTAEQLKLMWDGSCLVFTETPLGDLLRVGWRRAIPVCIICMAIGFGFVIGLLFWRWTTRVSRRHMDPARSHGLLLAGSCGITGFAGILLMTGLMTVGLRGFRAKSDCRLLLGASVLDLGDIPRGEPRQADIWVANAGRQTLHTDDGLIKTSCACVKAKVRGAVLLSGEKQPMRVYVGPKPKAGPFQHSVFVPSHNPPGGEILVVKGRIVGPGVAYPPRLYFRVAQTSLKETRKRFLYLGEYPDTRITGVTCDSPHVTCSLLEEKPGVALFEAVLSTLPEGDHFKGMITIATTDPSRATVNIPFSGVIKLAERQVTSSAD